MKIWVYLNGIQQGPYSLEQIALLPLEPHTPVWYEGLPKWLPAAEAPATASLFEAGQRGENSAYESAPQSEPFRAYAPGSRHDRLEEEYVAKPSTHLVWCILLTVFCCSPFGVAGLFTGAFSSQRYNRGDYAGAERMSEATEWLVILGIVFALIGWPLMFSVFL